MVRKHEETRTLLWSRRARKHPACWEPKFRMSPTPSPASMWLSTGWAISSTLASALLLRTQPHADYIWCWGCVQLHKPEMAEDPEWMLCSDGNVSTWLSTVLALVTCGHSALNGGLELCIILLFQTVIYLTAIIQFTVQTLVIFSYKQDYGISIHKPIPETNLLHILIWVLFCFLFFYETSQVLTLFTPWC